jgi:hypothetical protein
MESLNLLNFLAGARYFFGEVNEGGLVTSAC